MPPRLLIEYQLSDLMVQAITHSVEHRTQVCAILTALGHEPPDLSAWQWMVEAGTLLDLAPAEA